MANNVTGILLAAGKSSRFGSNKLLHPLPDSSVPVAVQAAKNLISVLPNSIAVVRPEDFKLKTLLVETGIIVVENPEAFTGISSSIRCGIESSIQQNSSEPDSLKAWVISLADMPYIPVEIYQGVVAAIDRGATLCAPVYKNRRGHPVGFSRFLEEELTGLSGDRGAKNVIEKHRDQLLQIPVTSETIFHDIDYPEHISTPART